MATDLRIAQAIGTLGCALAAGGIATVSILSIPNITIPERRPTSATLPFNDTPGASTTHLTHQWLDLYERGSKIFPGISAVSSLANLYALCALQDSPTPAPSILRSSWSTCYLLAAGITMSIAPFTFTVMKKTNAKLKAHAKRDDAAGAEGTEGMVVSTQEKAKRARDDSEVPELLQHWAKLNLIRATLPLVGAGIGFYAAVSSWAIP
ncbi:hypothetical protein N7491_006942 [Penicillium cf. griseofulvum]|uniref:DUF1772 domain-containing protein n=1 Tax=Penicillium cf. griseofulvum TaxID=2972120 RepID=A0A9W9IWH1_9EURO|nr:hypothetical protein N7472_010027 [Penicillium cf. griseofulvum]KAJ5429926.1 hypothetical protein N7491_006942 [Penicillium cf. griseofulvum]KAJ5436300.1 hypothetical protein N7445_007185 [Penicillium cf. griseofulvum]